MNQEQIERARKLNLEAEQRYGISFEEKEEDQPIPLIGKILMAIIVLGIAASIGGMIASRIYTHFNSLS